ncbi:MAG: sigma-70 family RNA polymerase sigma factor [Gemmatimonadota bacterium]
MSIHSKDEIAELIGLLVTRDADGFARLYDQTAGLVFGVLVRMLGSRELAEEVAQEVYLEIWKKAGSFDRKRGAGLSWITLIARSRALDRIRAEKSYRGALHSMHGAPDRQPLADAPPSPADDANLSQLRAVVGQAMHALPAEQRRAVELSFFGGLSHSEIAQATEAPLGTVKSRIRAGLMTLEARLEPRFRSQIESR